MQDQKNEELRAQAGERLESMKKEMSKAGCNDTPSGMSPTDPVARKMVAYASNRLNKEIFGWD